MKSRFSKKKLGLILLLAAVVFYYFCLPDPLFKDPYSTVLEDRNNELLSASIAPDGQWRFPENNSIPEKFIEALVLYEDKRFYSHIGFDPLSLGRALKQNIQAGKVVSGGSTLSMQVIRLARKEKSRSILEKIIEIILATRLELRYSKAEIIALYASHAPFGGNVVGIEAACWRYFARDAEEISWSEAALLAVLPNAPALIHPGKNRDLLTTKRNRLLDRLKDAGKIDSFRCELAKAEPIPEQPHPLPQAARHLLVRASKEGYSQRKIRSTIQRVIQYRVTQIVNDHLIRLRANHIHNAAAIVVEVETGNVVAYVGNATPTSNHHGEAVDIITSPRSTGSILKPFLYAAMLDEGKMLPKTLWPDIPTYINGFSPENFSHEYDGAVPADRVLIRSLNVPTVHMLRNYRYEKFHTLLKNMGFSSLKHAPDHYGLSLILGGAEGTLWDITGMYASMARTLNNYFEYPGAYKYDRNDYRQPAYIFSNDSTLHTNTLAETSWLSASAIYQTFEVLKEVYRPGEESGWRNFSSTKKIAWKTGTSFGFRDGWAIGTTPAYVVGVWVGNADGEGRPGLTGTDAAAPLMFDIFSQISVSSWFQKPFTDMERIAVCKKSGHRVTEYCEIADTVLVNRSGLESPPCPYHTKVHLTRDSKFRVHSECEAWGSIKTTTWFVLPPAQEFYYRIKNLSYKQLPPIRSDCQPNALQNMELIYPKANARIYIPREMNGQVGNAVFKLAHRNPRVTVYWHLDGAYLGSTTLSHQFALQPSKGKHLLTLIDDSGEVLERSFEIISSL